jgi:hypothetical protein
MPLDGVPDLFFPEPAPPAGVVGLGSLVKKFDPLLNPPYTPLQARGALERSYPPFRRLKPPRMADTDLFGGAPEGWLSFVEPGLAAQARLGFHLTLARCTDLTAVDPKGNP